MGEKKKKEGTEIGGRVIAKVLKRGTGQRSRTWAGGR